MWLGVDVGTGGSRALVVDESGRIVAGVTAAHDDILMLQPLWAEQRPENWWDAASVAIKGALREAGISGADIKGIGLSGQMHGLTLLDANNDVIRPALIWCDQRSQKQVDWVNQTVGRERVLECTANPVLTGFTLPKLLWVRDNEPEKFQRVRRVLLPKDYVRFRLTGEYATDVSDASGTSMFDVVRRKWSTDLVSAAGLDASILPTAYESPEVTGKVSKEAAELTGLTPGIPVVAGGGDQASSAVGNGVVEAGFLSCTLGTSGVVFAHMEQVAYDPAGRVHTFCHAVPGKWHVMGVTQGAGLSLQWFRRELATGVDYAALMDEAETSPPGAQGLFWLPYLMGERTPHLDAAARGGWAGLTASHKRADLVRSLVEGVCYSQRDCLDIIESLGVAVGSIRASGGGAKSPFWRQTLADILAKPVVTLETQEGSAFGAALLAMAGTGAFSSVPEACRAVVREVSVLKPLAANASVYAAGHRTYQALYPALKGALGW
jgi:xylulokinase